jgi:hypothetical protein
VSARGLVALVVLCAAARLAVARAPRARLEEGRGRPALPVRLGAEPGQPMPLDPSEKVLAAAPGVELSRRRYGTTQVALLTVRGLKEHHPPTVCLRAAGFEIVGRSEERTPSGCVAELRLRRGAETASFFHSYFDERHQTCSLWRRVGSAALAQLAGRSAQWSTLQVMDRDRARARRVIAALLPAPRRDR